MLTQQSRELFDTLESISTILLIVLRARFARLLRPYVSIFFVTIFGPPKRSRRQHSILLRMNYSTVCHIAPFFIQPWCPSARVPAPDARDLLFVPTHDSALEPSDDGGVGLTRVILECICGKLIRARSELRA